MNNKIINTFCFNTCPYLDKEGILPICKFYDKPLGYHHAYDENINIIYFRCDDCKENEFSNFLMGKLRIAEEKLESTEEELKLMKKKTKYLMDDPSLDYIHTDYGTSKSLEELKKLAEVFLKSIENVLFNNYIKKES